MHSGFEVHPLHFNPFRFVLSIKAVKDTSHTMNKNNFRSVSKSVFNGTFKGH